MSKRAIRLPAPLRALVRVVEARLGDVIRASEGPALYDAIERVRRSMVAFRETDDARARGRALRAARERLARADPARQARIARAYTIYLELVNACENAYRTHRLRSRRDGRSDGATRADVIYVLTAHPTESRSPENVEILRRIQTLLVEALERGSEPDAEALRHLLQLLWRVGTHPRHRPRVDDEAAHLYSLVSDDVLAELIDLARSGRIVRLRSWVGGDKDGHPGVGPRETLLSLQRSRDRLLGFVLARIAGRVERDASLLESGGVDRALRRLLGALAALERVREDDGRRVADLGRAVERLRRTWKAELGDPHPALERLDRLLTLFPGLVVPLELREERGRFGRRDPIASMLGRAVAVARGGRIDSYVAGVVVSMAMRPRNLLEACALVERVAGGVELPVIPLFELPEALAQAVEILEGLRSNPTFRRMARRQGRSVEIMLGYSDTSKRMGVLASRLAIGDTMQAIGAWGRRHGLRIVFFHGAGGSVGRGGGTFADRAAGWPSDFLVPHKETLQGEMVERTLSTPEILRSNVAKIAAMQARPPRTVRPGPLVRQLAEDSQRAFVDFAAAPELRELLGLATPYERLGALTIGSRPSRREGRNDEANLERLRAIPWVLCWTQTRYLLHAWLGIGTAWRRLRREKGAGERLRRELKHDPLLRAYLRTIGFTLAKTAPGVWSEYVRVLARDVTPELVRRLERERRDALDLARCGSPDGELLFDRRWLLESIRYRAPMIHPLNLLQIGTLERLRRGRTRKMDDELFRETVTGVAAGMLTTG